jgi:nucleoside-diphosphate-sugar epimerase
VYALQIGYRVRCVVRSNDAIQALKEGPSLQQFAGQIEYHIVPNNTVPDSYDSALADAQYVIHVAGVWPTPVSAVLFYVHPCILICTGQAS